MGHNHQYSSSLVDITYDAYFLSPVLDLPAKSNEILKRFHEIISPRYFLPLSALQSFGGNSFSDVMLKVILFDGKGIFELTPERLHVKFTGASTKDDIAVVKDCLTLAIETVKGSFPEAVVSRELVGANSNLIVSDEGFCASKHFEQFYSDNSFLYPDTYGASIARSGMRTEFENIKDSWRIYFNLMPALNDESTIVFSLLATYELGTEYTSINAIADHIDHITDKYLEGLGFVSIDNERLKE